VQRQDEAGRILPPSCRDFPGSSMQCTRQHPAHEACSNAVLHPRDSETQRNKFATLRQQLLPTTTCLQLINTQAGEQSPAAGRHAVPPGLRRPLPVRLQRVHIRCAAAQQRQSAIRPRRRLRTVPTARVLRS
jgi:hypothetical protein